MTSPDYGELVKNLHTGAIVSTAWGYTMAEAADAIEQQAREIAVLRVSGVYLANQALRLLAERDAARAELTRHGIPLPGEPDTRGTGSAGEVGCG